MLSEERYTPERISRIQSRIAAFLSKGATPTELGDVALEILIARNDLESRQEKGAKTSDVRKVIEQLKALEKAVISIYIMSTYSKAPSTKFGGYLNKSYSMYRRPKD
jgi:hypothetical protein